MSQPVGSLNNKFQISSLWGQMHKGNKPVAHDKDELLVSEKVYAPIVTSAKITTDKLQNAVTTYPVKGLRGSKNSNFYEFLTMGMFPYLTGSATMMAVFNTAAKYFKPDAAKSARTLGRKMALGTALYGVMKVLSKKLIEWPVKARYGVDVNLPYKKKVDELPESKHDTNLVSYEYHKVFESVDFPRFDMLYDQPYYGDKRNSYYDKVAEKMGLGKNHTDSDQLVKPKIKELIAKTRTFSTLSSYLWAATGVAIAMQDSFNYLGSGASKLSAGVPIAMRMKTFGKSFKNAVKELVNGGVAKNPKTKYAGRALLGAAIGVTLLGNIMTLIDFKKRKADKIASTPIIDDNKTKVVC